MSLLNRLGLRPTAAMLARDDARIAKDASARRYDVRVGIVALTQATLVDAMRALSAELARVKGLLDIEMQAHGQRMQRGADDAWEAAARIASEALGRAQMPPLEIWDPGYQALDEARRALRAMQIEQTVQALRRADAGLHAGRGAIARYDGQLEKGGERSITVLEGTKVAGAVAAGVATGGVAAAAEVGVLGSAAAAGAVGGAYGATQELAGEASAVYIADTKKQIDWAAVLRRGATDAVTGFVGGFVGGKLTERFCRLFGSYIGPLVSDAELLAMGQAQGLAGPLPRTAFMTATQKFAAEFLSGAALAPLQAAITQAINRISGGAPGPKNMEEFMAGVAKDIATGGVVQLLVAFLTHKMPPPPKSGGKPGGGVPHEAVAPAAAASAANPPPAGAPARNEAPMAHVGEPAARPPASAAKPRPPAAKPRPHGDLHEAAPAPKAQGQRPTPTRADLERAPVANDNVERPVPANDKAEQPSALARPAANDDVELHPLMQAKAVNTDVEAHAAGQQPMAMASGDGRRGGGRPVPPSEPGAATRASGGPPQAPPAGGPRPPARGPLPDGLLLPRRNTPAQKWKFIQENAELLSGGRRKKFDALGGKMPKENELASWEAQIEQALRNRQSRSVEQSLGLPERAVSTQKRPQGGRGGSGFEHEKIQAAVGGEQPSDVTHTMQTATDRAQFDSLGKPGGKPDPKEYKDLNAPPDAVHRPPRPAGDVVAEMQRASSEAVEGAQKRLQRQEDLDFKAKEYADQMERQARILAEYDLPPVKWVMVSERVEAYFMTQVLPLVPKEVRHKIRITSEHIYD